MTLITSSTNPRIRAIRDLHTTRGRRKSGLFLMEGPHLLQVLLDADITPSEVYYQQDVLERSAPGRVLLNRLLHAGMLPQGCVVEVSEGVMAAISDVQTSQGIVATLSLTACKTAQIRARDNKGVARPALLILDDLADPGNLGTILRTALAADVEAVLLTAHSVDPYGPKVVRAAAGAHLLLPIEDNLSWSQMKERVQDHCADRVFLAEMRSSHRYDEEDLLHPFTLIIGNETHGPSAEARALAMHTLGIPLANSVESLNAAIATGIILYESVRQLKIQAGYHQ